MKLRRSLTLRMSESNSMSIEGPMTVGVAPPPLLLLVAERGDGVRLNWGSDNVEDFLLDDGS